MAEPPKIRTTTSFPSSAMPQVRIDNADSTVTYSGVWVVSNLFTDNKTHVANSTVESKATLIFTGITVRVYGIAFNARSSYTIDGGNTTFPNANLSTSSFISTILLYTSPILLDGQHNLTIDANNLTISYFLVATTDSTPSSAVTSSTFTSSTSIDIQSPATSVADSAKSRNSSHRKVLIGVVVALVFVGIFTFICFWIRHRRKHLKKASEASVFVYPLFSSAVPHTQPANSPQLIELSSPANYPISEPPSYEAEDAGNLTSTPVGGSRHRTPSQSANPPQMVELPSSPANYLTTEPPPYEAEECRTSD